MTEANNSNTLSVYVKNCDFEENRSYETISDLEANFAGYSLMGCIDWESVDNATEWPVSSNSMRSNDQPPFVASSIDADVFGLFDMEVAPIEQQTNTEGLGFSRDSMNDYTFGETEATQTIPMNYQPDFIYKPMEYQYSYYNSEIAPPVAPQNEEKTCEKDWTVRDENTGKVRPPFLHEYLRKLLDDPNYSHVATYIDARKGIFKFHDKDMAAKLWQEAKQRNCDSDMTYEKFARAIRHYYDKDIIRRYRAHFTFCFGPNSGFGTTWSPV